MDQLLIYRIVYRIPVYSVLNEEHGQVLDSKAAQKSLILFILSLVDFFK